MRYLIVLTNDGEFFTVVIPDCYHIHHALAKLDESNIAYDEIFSVTRID